MNPRAWRIATGAFLALATVFALASVYVIFRQAVYIPYWDQWGWVDRYVSRSETLLSLIVTPINGHVVAVPGLLYWADIALTNASNRLNLIAMMACIAGICLLLRGRFADLADTFRGRTTEVYFATTVVLMLWFQHWESLFWPFVVHLYLSIFFAIASLFTLSSVAAEKRGRVGGLVAALGLGLLSGASFGSGLGVWAPALIVILLGQRPGAWKWGAGAAAASIAALLAWYLSSWVAYESHPIGPVPSLNFVALFLGSPFFHGYNERVLTTDAVKLLVPIVAGYAGLVLAGGVAVRMLRVRKRRPLRSAELFFVGVMSFALVVAAMTAFVRGGGGAPTPALASRYGVLCLLFWMAAVPLAVARLRPRRIRLVAAIAPIGLLALLVRSQVDYLGWWLNWRSMIEGASASLISGVPDPVFLGYVLHRPDMVERVTGELVRQRLSPIYEERSRWIGQALPESAGAVERCDDAVVAPVKLPAGFRLAGTVRSVGLPFAERPVFVTDADGRIVGLGNVDRGWYGSWGSFAAPRMRSWRAFAPVDEAGLGSVRVFVTTGAGLCEVMRTSGP